MGIRLSYSSFCRFSQKVLRIREYKLGEETRKELRRAGLDITEAQYASGLIFSILLPLSVICLAAVFLSALLEFESLLLFIFLGCVFLCLPSFLLFQLYPSVIAGQRISKERGNAIVTLLVLCFNLLHESDVRRAIGRASKGEGELAEDFRRVLLELEQGKHPSISHALASLAEKWSEVDETIGEVIRDISRLQAFDEPTRKVRLEKSISCLIEEIELEAEEKLEKLVSPTIYFLSFGALATVLVIGMFPLFALFGVNKFGLLSYLISSLALFICFFFFTSIMLRKRPLLLTPPRVSLTPRVKALTLSTPALLPIPFLRFSPFVILSLGVFLGIYFLARAWKGKSIQRARESRRQEWYSVISFVGERMNDGADLTGALAEASKLFPRAGEEIKRFLISAQSGSLDLYCAAKERRTIEFEDRLTEAMFEISLELKKRSENTAARAFLTASDLLGRLNRAEHRFARKMRETFANLWMFCLVLLPLVCSLSAWMIGVYAQVSRYSFPLFPPISTSEVTYVKTLLGLLSVCLSLTVARYMAGIKAPGDAVERADIFWKVSIGSSLVYLASLALFSLLA